MVSLLVASDCLRRRNKSTLERVRSTYIVSRPRIVVNAVSCDAVTSAPWVTDEMPMRPEIGAVTVVQSRLMRAVSSAAFSPLHWLYLVHR